MTKSLISVIVLNGLLLAVAAIELPVAKVTLHVVDEEGNNLSNIDANVTFLNPVHKPGTWGSSDSFSRSGKTDSSGLFAIEQRAGFEIHYGATGANYYKTTGRFDFSAEKDGRYQPWNPIFTVILKKIIHPIPMYARRLQTEIPASDQAVGFDLLESDWAAPYGKGKASDFVFTLHRRFTSRRDYESVVTLAFSNPGDGIHASEVQTKYGSELKLPRTAPNSGYASVMTSSISATPGGSGREDARPNRSYLFRVRTMLDLNNRPANGLYGKIDGDIRLDSINSKTCILLFTYYLNPNPNDQNMEFDPKRNLFTNLKDDERVTMP
jgi:hypothetical protein